MIVLLTCLVLGLTGCSPERGHGRVGPPHGGHARSVPAPVREGPRYMSWVCIHQHEAAWNDRDDPYWGGLQMDRSFMQTYGPDMIAKHRGGLADTWTPAEQITVAERAYKTRGFTPWPNTARACGVL